MWEGARPASVSTPLINPLAYHVTLDPLTTLQNASNLGPPPQPPTIPNAHYYARLFFDIALYIRVLVVPLSTFGIFTNILNMAVFFKLMDSDTVSVSLFGMSLSDFFVCLTTFLGAVLEFDNVQKFLLTTFFINPRKLIYLFIAFPSLHFARATLTISAFVTFERCLCVAMPLKVKSIFTSGRVKVIMVACFLFALLTAVPYYSTIILIWTFYPPLNRSVLDYTSKANYRDIVKYSSPFIIYAVYILLFAIIIVCTTILIVVLVKKMSWRKGVTSQTASSGSGGQVSVKEIKVIKMMVMVALLFIGCNIPCTGAYLTYEFDKSVSMEGSKSYLYFLLGYFVIIIQTFNSSVNIFIYYFNSTNYKLRFDILFGIKKKKDETAESEKK